MDTPIRLPYGISNFAQLIENHYYYVDKTRYIASLEREANPYQFFIRPRKIFVIIDDNLKTDYGRLQRLTMNEKNRETLLQIIKDDGIYSEVQTKFSIDRLSDTEHFVSLLFYMGLLTIDKTEQGLTWLKVPNYSIRTVYWEYLTRLIAEIRGTDGFVGIAGKPGLKKAAWLFIGKNKYEIIND